MRTKNSEADPVDGDEMRPEYSLKGAVRGKYAKRSTDGTNLVRIDPGVMDVFPDAAAVNAALRALASIIRDQTRVPA
jgi:hypothetical protein